MLYVQGSKKVFVYLYKDIPGCQSSVLKEKSNIKIVYSNST